MSRVAKIEALARADREVAARLLARAFRDNPLDLAVLGPDPSERLRSIVHGMRASLRSALGRCTVQLARLDGNPAGVLLAVPPGLFPLPPPSLTAHLRSLLGQGLRASARWSRVYRQLEEIHPLEPHWYLSLLGVDPPHQGSGVGRSLLVSWLASVDRERMPSYLETDRPENVAFYESAGFRVVHETRAFDAPIWCMSRPACPAPPPTGDEDALHAP